MMQLDIHLLSCLLFMYYLIVHGTLCLALIVDADMFGQRFSKARKWLKSPRAEPRHQRHQHRKPANCTA
jgi:hypothetical protein